MDTLDQQIQVLLEGAPNDGVTGTAMTAIAPTLKAIAERLQHSEYYVLQTLDQGWVMTTLSNRREPNVRRNIIYAYPTLADAGAGPQSVKDPQLMAIPTPVTHILFQMLALKSLDSLIFFETPGNLKQGVEIRRPEFQALLQAQLKEAQGYSDGDVAIG
ncbi:MAG: hypothetical protein O3C67_07885 [Cyanobacteria bacterium]|nr:hypothetical protein [Cyanobacteriota bacterium]